MFAPLFATIKGLSQAESLNNVDKLTKDTSIWGIILLSARRDILTNILEIS